MEASLCAYCAASPLLFSPDGEPLRTAWAALGQALALLILLGIWALGGSGVALAAALLAAAAGLASRCMPVLLAGSSAIAVALAVRHAPVWFGQAGDHTEDAGSLPRSGED